MKKHLSFLLVCVMLLTTLSVFSGVSAADPVTAVYVSDTGDNSNDGLTKDTPVKSIATAANILANGGALANAEGTIYVVGTVTYSASDAWLLPAAKKLTISGIDENSMFYLTRGTVGLACDVTFTNIKYKALRSGSVSSTLYAHNGTLTMADDVVTVPSDETNPTDRNQYPVISVGHNTTMSKNAAVYLNAGTYNYVYATGWKTVGSADKSVNCRLFIGKNVTVMDKIHVANSTSVVNGDIYIETHGASKAFCFNVGSKFNGNVKIKICKDANINGTFTVWNATSKASEPFANTKTMFADGKNLTIDACRNQAASNAMSEMVSSNGYRMIPYIENAPVFVGTQIRENDGSFDARFAATIDTLDYTNVGFKVTATWGENGSKVLDTECTKVYTALNAIVEGKTENETAEEYEGVYIYALTVQGVPTNVGAITFTVTPYALNGTDTYTGNSFTVVCTPGANGVAVA